MCHLMDALPDHMLNCKCCKLGVPEVKCPYSGRDTCFKEKEIESAFFNFLINWVEKWAGPCTIPSTISFRYGHYHIKSPVATAVNVVDDFR